MKEEDSFPSFKVDVDGIMKMLRSRKYSKVLLQGPEGLKRGMLDLASRVEEGTSCTVWLDGEYCYGACDHAGERAKVLGADALIHLGHSDIPSMERASSVPIHFFPVEMRSGVELVHGGIGKLHSITGGKKVALFTTIQHMELMNEVGDHLISKGANVHIGGPGDREEYPGQVLGCSFAAARDLPGDVDVLLFIGTGNFHPMGLSFASEREVLTVDPMTGEVGRIEQEFIDRTLRSRFGHINKFKGSMREGKRIGVVVGYKPGQRRLTLAGQLLGLLKDEGLKATMVIMDHMEPMKLRALGFELVVSTTCPRIAIDDHSRYSAEGITVITPMELRIALDILSWSDYSFDEEW